MTSFEKFKSCLEALTGFKRYAAAFALGAIMTLTTAPVAFVPLLLLCAPGFAILARNAPTRLKSFAVGWAFGAGYFISGLYWVSAALFVDIQQWKWVLPLSLVVGPAVLALHYGLIPLLARRFRDHEGAYALALVVSWAAVEWLRGHWLTGFPWNLAGSAWHHILPALQAASVVGIYGLTLLTLFWAMLPLFIPAHKRISHIAIVSLACVIIWGGLRLSVNPTEQSGSNTVRIVQANIPQAMKWDQDEDWRNFEKHLDLSARPSRLKDPVTFVVWPETAVHADMTLFPEIAQLISQKLPKDTVPLLGALRVVDTMGAMPQFFNSVSVLGEKGKVLANYDKHHLVPFGEYIPFRDRIDATPIALMVAGIGDFTRGPGPRTIKVDGLPGFSPLVCYEAIFPGAVANESDRPAWLVNVTNDGWYGKTAGPHQHFANARMRAIEEGLPLARAANTGISAMIDPLGRIMGLQPLGTSGYVDDILPLPLPPTVYARFGDLPFFILLALLAGAAIVLRRESGA